MSQFKKPASVFPSAGDDAHSARQVLETAQTSSSAYRLAYTDDEFLLRDELRPVRLQLELLKPDLIQDENNIHSTVVIFGSSRIPEADVAAEKLDRAKTKALMQPENSALARKVKIAERVLFNSRYYDESRKLSQLITAETENNGKCELVVITGGGPGLMEAANRGAVDVGGKSIGLNIVLPFELHPNPYVLKRARALVACPGGFGTLDELFDALTLIQTKKIKPVPVLLLGSEYWRRVINFDVLVEEGMIDEQDLTLFKFVDSAEEAWKIISEYWGF